MDGQHTVECIVKTPHYSPKAENDQCTVDHGTESDLPELRSDAALENIA